MQVALQSSFTGALTVHPRCDAVSLINVDVVGRGETSHGRMKTTPEHGELSKKINKNKTRVERMDDIFVSTFSIYMIISCAGLLSHTTTTTTTTAKNHNCMLCNRESAK